jgi:hypothetical protein
MLPDELSSRPLGWRLSEFRTRVCPMSNSKLHLEIRAGRLRVRKMGRASLITYQDGVNFINSLPVREVRP